MSEAGKNFNVTAMKIAEAHRLGTGSPEHTIRQTYARIRAYADPALFITLRDEDEAVSEASAMDDRRANGPLFGVPIAVKDNIDVAGLPTTAACPAYAYAPKADAAAVARLRQAGAIVIGKTNLDQFATGLVGVRSPYGVPRNPFDAKIIPGGSSSGSAVAVAAGLVPIALGTDTAGSGRVPAGLNNIVGLKPSVGLVPATGVVPACRSLDCVSIFALTVDDAFEALSTIAGPDASDPYSRDIRLSHLGAAPAKLTIAAPDAASRIFDDRGAEQAFAAALDILRRLGATIEEIDLSPFFEAARLLYEGPWVAERYAAVGEFVTKHPDEIHPVTRDIIAGGSKPLAVDAFRAFYRLRTLRRTAHELLARFDAVMTPTAPAAYTIEEIIANPVTLNSRLGTYTNFVNLLDLSALAIPAAIVNGVPYGVTFLAPSGHDSALASLGRTVHARMGLALGAGLLPHPPLAPLAASTCPGEIAVAVVGAHLSGMSLNGELRALHARFIEEAKTAPDYRLFLLSQTAPRKPGMLRVASGEGASIGVELWGLTAENFGRFVVAVPPPLSIGTLRLDDGRCVPGFLVESQATVGARDISTFEGWRAFVDSERTSP